MSDGKGAMTYSMNEKSTILFFFFVVVFVGGGGNEDATVSESVGGG